eukprot:jgi/Mesvir1/242/Mv13585-RA.1
MAGGAGNELLCGCGISRVQEAHLAMRSRQPLPPYCHKVWAECGMLVMKCSMDPWVSPQDYAAVAVNAALRDHPENEDTQPGGSSAAAAERSCGAAAPWRVVNMEVLRNASKAMGGDRVFAVVHARFGDEMRHDLECPRSISAGTAEAGKRGADDEAQAPKSSGLRPSGDSQKRTREGDSDVVVVKEEAGGDETEHTVHEEKRPRVQVLERTATTAPVGSAYQCKHRVCSVNLQPSAACQLRSLKPRVQATGPGHVGGS